MEGARRVGLREGKREWEKGRVRVLMKGEEGVDGGLDGGTKREMRQHHQQRVRLLECGCKSATDGGGLLEDVPVTLAFHNHSGDSSAAISTSLKDFTNFSSAPSPRPTNPPPFLVGDVAVN